MEGAKTLGAPQVSSTPFPFVFICFLLFYTSVNLLIFFFTSASRVSIELQGAGSSRGSFFRGSWGRGLVWGDGWGRTQSRAKQKFATGLVWNKSGSRDLRFADVEQWAPDFKDQGLRRETTSMIKIHLNFISSLSFFPFLFYFMKSNFSPFSCLSRAYIARGTLIQRQTSSEAD